MLKTGLVQVYTGQGPYPNFAPFGLALRAAGQGLRTHVVSFTDHPLLEVAPTAASRLSPQLTIDRPGAVADGGRAGASRGAILSSYRAAEKRALGGQCDLLILDGISTLFSRGVVEAEEVLALIGARASHVELVLSGFAIPEALIERADLVTEMVVRNAPDREHGARPHSSEGPIEVVTGNGKGKTTYCLGKALLMSCLGIRTAFLQFMKSPQAYGEVKAIRRLPGLGIKSMGAGFLMDNTPEARKAHQEAARRAWEHCLREIFSLKYGLVVLDEINTATYYGLVNPERVREMLFLKPAGLAMLLSGRNAHLELIPYASLVIEMLEIKHPYRRGIKARRGIEF
jgi:cob(I)alamin adenosyltransferase